MSNYRKVLIDCLICSRHEHIECCVGRSLLQSRVREQINLAVGPCMGIAVSNKTTQVNPKSPWPCIQVCVWKSKVVCRKNEASNLKVSFVSCTITKVARNIPSKTSAKFATADKTRRPMGFTFPIADCQ